GVHVFFATGEGPDEKESAWTLLQLQQEGLGLPDRDYYFDEDKADKRALYRAHVASVLDLLGEADPAAGAAADAAEALPLEAAAVPPPPVAW
ncbi:MAG: M13 family peptidase, partial [Pseudomonadota bacterium]|nr:M13 family peptidase [Pseudomonadota bacterium]